MQNEFVFHIAELLQALGPVRVQRMFGGHGFFLGDLMFALEADNVLYLKTDANTVGDFTDRGLEAFTYVRQGKTCALSYFQAPEEVLEDGDAMKSWANRACGAAARAAVRKSR